MLGGSSYNAHVALIMINDVFTRRFRKCETVRDVSEAKRNFERTANNLIKQSSNVEPDRNNRPS